MKIPAGRAPTEGTENGRDQVKPQNHKAEPQVKVIASVEAEGLQKGVPKAFWGINAVVDDNVDPVPKNEGGENTQNIVQEQLGQRERPFGVQHKHTGEHYEYGDTPPS